MFYDENSVTQNVGDTWLSCAVTVGVCAYNEGFNIGNLLRDILHEQELPAESEVIVVCSGCTDNTVSAAEEHARADPRVKLLVEEARNGKTSAINNILHNARGSSILLVSADTLPSLGCFARLLGRLKTSQVGIVCGNPVPTNGTNTLVNKLVQMLWSMHCQVFAELNDAGLARHATEVFCIRRGIVNEIPAETVNDDAYIAVTAKKQGWLIKFEPKATVLIRGPETFTEYLSQRRRILWGHRQIKRITGEPPQHPAFLLPFHPVRVFRFILRLCATNSLPTVVAFTSTEIVASGAALMDFFLGKSYLTWSVAASTKRVTYPQTKKNVG